MTYTFRLIRCRACGWKTWTQEREGETVDLRGVHPHDDLWEEQTFSADDRNGPGLALTPLGSGTVDERRWTIYRDRIGDRTGHWQVENTPGVADSFGREKVEVVAVPGSTERTTMGSSPMKTIAPRVYVAGDRHLKPGILLWIGPMSPRKLARPLPRWRRVHHRHLRLPLPKGLIRRLWPDV